MRTLRTLVIAVSAAVTGTGLGLVFFAQERNGGPIFAVGLLIMTGVFLFWRGDSNGSR